MEKKSQSVYIVTGAAGHLGSAVAEKLIEQGKTVYALCLPGEKHPPKNVKIFYGDVRDAESLAGIFESGGINPLIVIHCAGVVSISSSFNQNVYDVNVTGTKNIISLCEKYKVKKLIHVSSVHAIPEQLKGEKIIEVDKFSPDYVVGLYAKTKAEATQCVLDYSRRGFYACVVHPSGITGPGDFGRGHITQLVIDYCKGGLASGINGGYDFVDVRDVADGIISCCGKGKSGECYILSGHYFKIYELLNLLHEITGKRKIRNMLPLWFVKVTAPLSELYYKILRQPPLFTTYSIYTLNTNANFNNEKAVNELGYTARPMKQTLEDTVKWLKENGRM
ncbi:MAG: NAD-dependent epimerase/dehydratase family protein [Treponema sp.]|nr:NAD-dependent epimerase/dehydratase family protein [Treponema sp.]MCL2271450.1 NAD-dependent epimerase/dehydratase family protein [Treponema sp.]